jgi:sarcosine oxidase subunit alpha
MTGFRLPAGGAVDRARPLSFTFDGRAMTGFAGDTLASALLANGVRLVARSFKLHRPRGIVAAGPEEPNALVTVGLGARATPNLPATQVELHDGLVAVSQNRWPSLGLDLMAVNSILAPLFPAGFYYKTFMSPGALWERLYEPAIRRAAGLGRAPVEGDPDAYEHVHHHCDVLVVGAGAAGIAAAARAAGTNARVMLLERDTAIGGWALVDGAALPALPANVTVLTRTAAIGVYDTRVVAAVEHVAGAATNAPRQRLHVIRPGHLVLATGAVERLIAFPGNDRPGVMLAGAIRAHAARFGVACGRSIALFGANDRLHEHARALVGLGCDVAAIIDPRQDSPGIAASRAAGLRVLAGHEACGTSGARSLHGVQVRRVGTDGSGDYLSADALGVSGGLVPQAQLASQAGLTQDFDAGAQAFVPRSNSSVTVVGALATRDGKDGTVPLFEVRAPGKAFVDLQNDVTADDVRLAAREGYAHVEHMKRYTTHGMGTDQGRIGGLLGAAILAEALGRPLAEVGVSKPRPFTEPTAWGALAGPDVGHAFKPERRLPLHDRHAAMGAVFVRIGLWLRPLVYSPTGDTSWGPVLEEARAVRSTVGVTDVSSLGKLDVRGPDAAAFLDLIYANTASTLKPGRTRYGLMLREDGILFDDGTIARLGPDHFLLSTTTQKSEDVLAHMEWHLETVWPDLDVSITNVADHWAQFAVAGPRARAVVKALVDVDVGNEAFPFMAVAPATIAGVPGRLFRISFSGELGYELAVPAAYADHVFAAILAAGAPHGIVPYGLDALNVLRVEKGHVTGAEINGQTTAADLGLGKMLKSKGDFIGKALSGRPGLNEASRLKLVGVRPLDTAARLRGGAHLTAGEGRPSQGTLTSVVKAAEGEGFIALALLANGDARHGEHLVAASPVYGEHVAVVVESPHRVDPENARVRA